MAGRPRFPYRLLFAIVALAAIVYATSGVWLAALGRGLIYNDGPGKADIAVVLAGDYTGGRIVAAAELTRKGYVPLVLVSGPPGFYGLNEADAAIRFITAKGYPAAWFVPLRHTGLSTQAEAGFVLNDLQRRGVHSFILVTSNYHSRRARRLFLKAEKKRGGGPELRAFAAPDGRYDPAAWWRSREGRKIAFLEWTKTVTSLFGI